DGTGTGYITELGGNRVRKINLTGYSLTGTLPAGLTFDPATGIISGTPTGTIASSTVTVTAYNSSGYSTATVNFAPVSQTAPNISYASSNNLTVGTAATISPVNSGGTVPNAPYGQVTSFVGSPTGVAGYSDASTTSAQFNWPQQLVRDPSTGNLFIADGNNNVIRKITAGGDVTTFAGNIQGYAGYTDDTGTQAQFNYPDGIAIDANNNLYVSDYNNNAIRKITPSGIVTTFYSSLSTFGPGGLCFDGSGNLLVAAQDLGQVLRISPAGVVSTVAGSTVGYNNGSGSAVQFDIPSDVKVDPVTGNIYVADFQNNAIRMITPAGAVSTFAGSLVNGNQPGFADGVGTAAVFNNPTGLAMAPGGVIYVADMFNNNIRRIMPDQTVSLVVGSAAQVPGDADGIGTAAGLNEPDYLYLDGTGTGYITELGGNRVRKINLTGYSLTGTLPAGLTFDPATGIISGTPTAQTANTQFSVTAYNAYGYSTSTFNIKASAGLPNNPAGDYNRNWVYVRTYDENGVETGATKSFFDNNAKATQTQTKNETTGDILATQTIYDLQSRPVVSTLPAPTNNSAFAYRTDFVTANNLPYSYLNFDGDPTNTSAPYAKLNNPDAVDNATQGTLGWYYSDNNTSEPYVAATGYPYSRGDFYHDGTAAAKRSAGVGSQLKMGTGHETRSNTFQVQNELNNYLAIRNQFFPSAVVGSSPSGMAGQALQTISTDQNGTSAITITDLSGKNTLMTARADGSASAWLSVTNTVTSTTNPPDFEVSVTTNQYSSFTINSNQVVNIYYNGSATPQYTGSGNNYNYNINSNGIAGTYLITSVSPFSYSYADPTTPAAKITDAPVTISESAAANQYFCLTSQSAVTITGGSYTLWDMTAEQDITSAYQANHTLQPGYYKVVATAPTANAGLAANTVTVSYINTYSDIAYAFYNQLGELVGSITPNGVQKLLANGYSGYTSASQLPFVTLYSYDLQGHLTSVSTPDGGTSNYIYTTDGTLRFSQNAVQRNTVATGGQEDLSFVEKISYTNYDNVGRPVESGEYVIPNGTSAVFTGLYSNTSLLDATDATANITGATKQSQVNTYYDLPDPNPAYISSLNGYIQDAGFLKGAISYTSNANSTTWYNYDDHGRIIWTVKYINGLGYKTINYTYDEKGNVIKVDYQKDTPAERFIHYYAYDAGGRLASVETSRDDVTKKQQANYYYYLHGPLKRVELGDHLQGIDYVYTAQGWLKSINTATGVTSNDPGQDGSTNGFANDAFGMQLEYFSGDYSRINSNINSVLTGQQTYYNGNVNGISWQSNKPSSVLTGNPGIQNPVMYTYSYNSKYQLTGAIWGTPSFTGAGFTANNTFNESNIKYDPNGNITSLKRTGTNPDDFSDGYTYGVGTNQLTNVHDATKNADYANYTYNEIGQLKSETLTGAASPYYLQYNVMDKVTGIYSDQLMSTPLETFSYDELGNRVKTVNANGTTYYVYDASGNVMAIYNGTSISETPVYGSNRLGTYFYSSSNYQYELRDNIGSVRVVMNGAKNSNGQADIVKYNDYYPYGSIVQSGGSDLYRYDYQGAYAEKDAITGWNNFQLRMYDSKIGRWLMTDPAGQFASPYEGMGNNPVTGTDPTGGEEYDWYKNDDTGAVIWLSGNEATKTIDNQEYHDVGDVYAFSTNSRGADGSKWVYSWVGGPNGVTTLMDIHNISGNADGVVNSINVDLTFVAGMSLEVGHVTDWTGKGKWFFSISGNLGLSVGAGINHRIIKSNKGEDFRVRDYEGTGSSFAGNIEAFGGSYGGDTNPSDPAHFNPFTLGEKFTETGGVLGGDAPEAVNPASLLLPKFKAGATWSVTRTYLSK
ncbi:MAG TPA: putative Ig domain-containing protein, partial [Mucilaginibacter sp.]